MAGIQLIISIIEFPIELKPLSLSSTHPVLPPPPLLRPLHLFPMFPFRHFCWFPVDLHRRQHYSMTKKRTWNCLGLSSSPRTCGVFFHAFPSLSVSSRIFPPFWLVASYCGNSVSPNIRRKGGLLPAHFYALPVRRSWSLPKITRNIRIFWKQIWYHFIKTNIFARTIDEFKQSTFYNFGKNKLIR